MIRPPPSSPLFPYTTLFRSWTSGRSTTACRGPGTVVDAGMGGGAGGGGAGGGSAGGRDRKSTRLNSSHLGISYAVFCLKKKKKKKQKVSRNVKEALQAAVAR